MIFRWSHSQLLLSIDQNNLSLSIHPFLKYCLSVINQLTKYNIVYISYCFCFVDYLVQPFDHQLIEQTNHSMLYIPFWIHLLFTIHLMPEKLVLYVSNHSFVFDDWMQIFNNWLIDKSNVLRLLLPFYNLSVLIANKSNFKTYFQRFIFQSIFVLCLFWGNFPWGFSLDISAIYCWLVCLCW